MTNNNCSDRKVQYARSQKPYFPTYRHKLLMLGCIIASIAAVWHLLCVVGGPSWYEFARAPKVIIQSAKQGTWLAPISTMLVAGLMFACSVFALSTVGMIRQLPLRRTAMAVITVLCLLRGGAIVPLWLSHLYLIDDFMVISSAVWFLVGLCYFLGLYESFQDNINK
ncbi:hypothetical protein AADZ91_01090 [Colwelliaceae bacterium 6441]